MVRRARTRGPGNVVAVGVGLALAVGLLPGLAAKEAAATPSQASAVTAPQPSAQSAETGGTASDSSAETQALSEAKRSGEKVEVLSLRGESSEVFATPEGELEAVEHLRPVRTRIGGEWKPVDTTLVKSADGMVAPRAATVGLEFSGGGERPLVRMERVGRTLALSWPTALPAPRLDGDTATYAEVLPGVDLRVRAEAEGFSQLLVVKSAEAAANEDLAELRLRLGTDAMSVRETAAGGLEAVDDGAKGVVFEAPTPFMWDSSTGQAPEGGATRAAARATEAGASTTEDPGPAETGKLAPLDVEVASGGDELVLTPDRDVLAGQDTVYPVYIDPQWYSPKATAWTMASKYWADSPQWKFNGDPDAGMGYCDWARCKPSDTKRLFYRIPTSRFAGKAILSAEFTVRETHAASCTKTGVELWRTKDISSSTTWNSQLASGFWIDKLDTRNYAYGGEGCEADDAEFQALAAVKEAAAKSWPTLTFGLQAEDEGDPYSWKRFSDDAFLRVSYNRPPPQLKMSQLTSSPGGTCQGPESIVPVRSVPVVRVNNVTDPDGDEVAVQLRASWDEGDGFKPHWTPEKTAFKRSGSDFIVDLPSTIPMDKKVNWYARVWDDQKEKNYSPWSYNGSATGCYFRYDPATPEGPAVTSSDYPPSPANPWVDGFGRYGEFVIDAPDDDVVTYWYGVNSQPTSRNAVSTTKGAARTIRVLPTIVGTNFITAVAFDAAGRRSHPSTYYFGVQAGQPERGIWELDESAGAVEAAGNAPARPLQLHGGAVTGAEGAMGTALSLDGVDDYADTDVPMLSTGRGFSVSAWVKPSKLPDTGTAVVAAQRGNNVPGFVLYYSKSYDRWVFSQYAADAEGAAPVRVMQSQPGGVKAGEWTQLIGAYDSTSDELRLYVNGTLAGTTSYSTPWDARRGLQVGASSHSGEMGSFFSGQIDEVEFFDKPLAANEVALLYGKQHIRGPERPALAIFPMDEAPGATEVIGRGDVLPAVFHGGVKPGGAGVDGKALALDGVDDYATIGAPHFNTSRSFAVSVWAKLPKTKPDHAVVVLNQSGVHKSGIELYYSSAYDRWIANQHSADSADATPIRAIQSTGPAPQGGEWAHLVAVHDTIANTLILYVNGEEAGTATLGNAWYASGPIQIGASYNDGVPGSHFPGQIDDLRLFDRPLSDEEVRRLFRQEAVVKGRWQLEKQTDAVSPDASDGGHNLRLSGGAGIGFGRVDDYALELDGSTGYAATTGTPVDTSGSFTVTAWAKTAAALDGSAESSAPVTVISAEGNQQSAFAIRYQPTPVAGSAGRWQVTMPSQDASGATVVTVENLSFRDLTEWNHLAVVYDAYDDRLRLYVNGLSNAVICLDTDDAVTAAEEGCTDQVPWAWNTVAFNATKSLQLGRAKSNGSWGGYWPGAIDDVWAFQGALTEAQVQYLAQGISDIPATTPGSDGG